MPVPFDSTRPRLTAVEADLSGVHSQIVEIHSELDGIELTPGEAGPQGNPGKSAYQNWLDAGHSGTEAQFLASLVGPAGADGQAGPAGDPASNLVQSVNGQQDVVILTGDDISVVAGSDTTIASAFSAEVTDRAAADDELTNLINNGLSAKVSYDYLTDALTEKVDNVVFSGFASEIRDSIDTKADQLEVTMLTAEVATKAPKASPTFTGTVAVDGSINQTNSKAINGTFTTGVAVPIYQVWNDNVIYSGPFSDPSGGTGGVTVQFRYGRGNGDGLAIVLNGSALTYNASALAATFASISGVGSGLTNLNASNINSGTINAARVPTLPYLKLDGSTPMTGPLQAGGDVTVPQTGALLGSYGQWGMTGMFVRAEGGSEVMSLFYAGSEMVIIDNYGIAVQSVMYAYGGFYASNLTASQASFEDQVVFGGSTIVYGRFQLPYYSVDSNETAEPDGTLGYAYGVGSEAGDVVVALAGNWYRLNKTLVEQTVVIEEGGGGGGQQEQEQGQQEQG